MDNIMSEPQIFTNYTDFIDFVVDNTLGLKIVQLFIVFLKVVQFLLNID
jgi:hypothetical protein